MRIRPFNAILPQKDLIASVDSFFSEVKEDFSTYKKAGFFQKSKTQVLYIYRIDGGGHHHEGIIAANDILDLKDNKILKHERTIAAKEQHMLGLTIERRAQIKPVLLAYPGKKHIDSFITKTMLVPADIVFEFDGGKVKHELWEVKKKPRIEKLVAYFADIPVAYVADGHHRCATSFNLNQSQNEGKHSMSINDLLVLYMSFKHLEIHDFNRIVDLSESISPAQLIAQLSVYCKIKPLSKRKKPGKKHEMTCCIEGEWYRLRWRKAILDKNKGSVIFDTALLNTYILEGILGIKDVRSDPRIEYKSGVNGLKSINQVVNRNKNKVAFCMFPITPMDLMKVADKNRTLPPKSTWFEPRVKNGMVGIEL